MTPPLQGDIIAVMGVDCASGDTYATDPKTCTLESIFVPDPVIKIAINPAERGNADKLGKALQRFMKEDPTFRVQTDEETGETIIAGMGELHLDVYIERIRREYKVAVEAGAPKVSYREMPTQKVEFNHKRKKQTGGSGQYGHIVGYIEPLPDDAEEPFIFEESVVQGRIPKQYFSAIEKGFRVSLVKGPIAGYPVEGTLVHVKDGSYHDVDSSEMAFNMTAQECFRENFPKTKPALLEPVMLVEIECPEEFQGSIAGDVPQRRGMIITTDSRGDGVMSIKAEVPLSQTFGYATDLRSLTQGKGTFTMELSGYKKVPANVQQEIVEEKRKAQLVNA